MSHWETVNNILRAVIPVFLTLVLGQVALEYYDVIETSSSIVTCEIAFGIVLLFGSIIFHFVFSMRKITELLMKESIQKRPFREFYTYRQIGIWHDISSNILRQGKKFVPFGIGFLTNTFFLERTFKRNMEDIKESLNTKYKNKVEDEISGKDAILIAAKKSYEEDLEQYYNEKIFNKNNNFEKYGKTLPIYPIAETTNFEKSEKLYEQIKFTTKILLPLFFISLFFIQIMFGSE